MCFQRTKVQQKNQLCKIFSKKNVVSSLIHMILLKRLPVAGYCEWTFEVGRQSRVGALEVQQKNQLCKIFSKKNVVRLHIRKN